MNVIYRLDQRFSEMLYVSCWRYSGVFIHVCISLVVDMLMRCPCRWSWGLEELHRLDSILWFGLWLYVVITVIGCVCFSVWFHSLLQVLVLSSREKIRQNPTSFSIELFYYFFWKEWRRSELVRIEALHYRVLPLNSVVGRSESPDSSPNRVGLAWVI